MIAEGQQHRPPHYPEFRLDVIQETHQDPIIKLMAMHRPSSILFSGCADDLPWPAILATSPNIEDIVEVGWSDYSSRTMQTLGLIQLPRLRKLILRSSRQYSPSEAFCAQLGKLTHLEELELGTLSLRQNDGNSSGGSSAACLQACECCVFVRLLRWLENVTLTEESVSWLCRPDNPLKRLDLSKASPNEDYVDVGFMSAIAFVKQLARMTGLAELNLGHVSGSDYQKERDSDGEVAILVPALVHLRTLSLSTTAASVEYRKLEPVSLKKLKTLTEITSFGLSCMRLRPAKLQVIGELKQLVDLNLEYCYIKAAGMAELANLTELTRLNLCTCELGDEGASHLSKFLKLRYLNLNNNQLTWKAGQFIGALEQLRELDIGNNKLGEAGARQLSKCYLLELLRLDNNGMCDEGMHYLSRLPLRRLLLWNNGISNECLKELSRTTTLQILCMQNNKELVGTTMFRYLMLMNNLRVLNMGFRPQRELVSKMHRLMLPQVPQNQYLL